MTTELAAHSAHSAAIDDQSIAETQYDTVAIEAGYLAEGQSKRVAEIKYAITLLNQLASSQLTDSTIIKVGSLIQLKNSDNHNQWLFIAPAAGGVKCVVEERNITVITPHSPMGKALINKEAGDEIALLINGTSHENINYVHDVS